MRLLTRLALCTVSAVTTSATRQPEKSVSATRESTTRRSADWVGFAARVTLHTLRSQRRRRHTTMRRTFPTMCTTQRTVYRSRGDRGHDRGCADGNARLRRYPGRTQSAGHTQGRLPQPGIASTELGLHLGRVVPGVGSGNGGSGHRRMSRTQQPFGPTPRPVVERGTGNWSAFLSGSTGSSCRLR